MGRRLASISDTTLAFIIALLGMAGLAIGFSTVAHPFDISPSLDGTLTAVQLGFVLAVLHGLGFRRALTLMAPVLLVLVAAAVRQGESVFALLGVTLTLYGVIGIGLAMLVHSHAEHAG